ncbi:MAG: hypothetical protein ACLQMU_01350 [Methanoregula sp.]|uniref:hypothetical protein n=1 Tax=Methanoregula sp. TaxID=2052170 RepID=UPI003C521724
MIGTSKKADEQQRFAAHYNLAMNDLLNKNPEMPLKDAVHKATQTAKDATQKDAVYTQDPIFYRTAEILLAIIVLVVVVGSIWLFSISKAPSDGIIAIGSGAVGALIGVFSTQK